jgi:hypothetical protein
VDDYLTQHTPQLTASHFFESICPRVLTSRRAALARLGGSYAFALTGEAGGHWRLDLAAGTVERDSAAPVDVSLELSAADFVKLLKGTLDVERALKTGDLKLTGDRARLKNLSIAFLPA